MHPLFNIALELQVYCGLYSRRQILRLVRISNLQELHEKVVQNCWPVDPRTEARIPTVQDMSNLLQRLVILLHFLLTVKRKIIYTINRNFFLL
jgi:hypothetical protein